MLRLNITLVCSTSQSVVLIMNVNTDYVMNTLRDKIMKHILRRCSGTVNLKSLKAKAIVDTDLYTIVHKDQEFYDSKR